MARYYFHYWSEGRLWVPDDDGGCELADLRAAHRHALKLIRQTLHLFSNAHEARNWYIEIADDQNRPVLAVLFPSSGSALHGVLRVVSSVPADCIVDVHV
jgi:hypothetical protein